MVQLTGTLPNQETKNDSVFAPEECVSDRRSPLQDTGILGYRESMQESGPLHRLTSGNEAFSLIELLVVLAIIVILTTLYWSDGPSKRDRELTDCRANLERIYLAMDIYSRDNAGKFPAVADARTSEDELAVLVPRYSSDISIFTCPASSDSPLRPDKPFRDGKISYAYYMGRHASDDAVLMSDEQVDTRAKQTGATVFSSTGKAPGNNHGKEGGNFLKCDGSVISSTGEAPFSLTLPQPVVLLNTKP